jgi:hypothetical protein
MASVMDEIMGNEHCWNNTDWKKQILGEKSVPVALSPPQIPHRLVWE